MVQLYGNMVASGTAGSHVHRACIAATSGSESECLQQCGLGGGTLRLHERPFTVLWCQAAPGMLACTTCCLQGA